ncbi:hypothetical protein PoB_000604300 [Plakobranchus ocellatus]|uniref:Uncharacterized protein n=1 Tax=Plakobranchus ocellatus TaxID=259542 RepID=A0AAV3YBL4_9GAST|nr:hypothetical protein PoB_000604300 [Plakobranchus ocellatus]
MIVISAPSRSLEARSEKALQGFICPKDKFLFLHLSIAYMRGRRWHSGYRVRPEICRDLSVGIRAPPQAPWPEGGPESLRSPCCGLAIYKNIKNRIHEIGLIHRALCRL